ncbi:hypothetical protein EBZ39_02325 [bacterium]|nr:hypothetical protein [bacterium]
MTYSPGSWRVGDPHIATGAFRGETLKDGNNQAIAIVLCGDSAKENGQLLAAAPDLVAALWALLHQCQQMKDMFPDGDGNIENAINDAKYALAKAGVVPFGSP